MKARKINFRSNMLTLNKLKNNILYISKDIIPEFWGNQKWYVVCTDGLINIMSSTTKIFYINIFGTDLINLRKHKFNQLTLSQIPKSVKDILNDSVICIRNS